MKLTQSPLCACSGFVQLYFFCKSFALQSSSICVQRTQVEVCEKNIAWYVLFPFALEPCCRSVVKHDCKHLTLTTATATTYSSLLLLLLLLLLLFLLFLLLLVVILSDQEKNKNDRNKMAGCLMRHGQSHNLSSAQTYTFIHWCVACLCF